MKTWWRRFSVQPSPDVEEASGGARGHLVDAHVHVFPPDVIDHRTRYLGRDLRFDSLYRSAKARMVTADEVIEAMDRDGVAVSIVFGFAFEDQGLCRMVNDYVLEAVRAHPDRLAGLACVSPAAAGARTELERCLDAGLRGCGELAPSSATWEDSSEWADLACCLRERSLPLLVHASEPVGHDYTGKGSFTPETCVALIKAFPGLVVVLAHLGGGLFLYELMPEMRDLLRDVYYDTAAVPYLYGPGVYPVAAACAGSAKLIFGSDYPLLDPGRYGAGIARLDPADREAVTCGNARRVFGL